VIAHPKALKAVVLCRENGTVYEIDATKLTVSRRARVGDVAKSMQLSPAGDAVWVLTGAAELVEVPLKSMEPGRRIKMNLSPDSFALNGDNAVIASAHHRAVMLASLKTGAIRGMFPMEDEPSLLTFRKDGRFFFVASRPERVLRICDTETGRTVVRLPLPVEPLQFSMKPDGGQLFITGAGLDAVVIVYVYQTEIAETLLAGRAPGATAAMDSPAYLMVANPETDRVTVLDLDNSGRLVASVQVGQGPRSIVMTPAREDQDQYALVLNEKSGDLAVIRVKSLPATAEARRWPTPIFALIQVGEKPVSAAVMTFA
jgi:DNA-binding beta-propeller fold protein YncE